MSEVVSTEVFLAYIAYKARMQDYGLPLELDFWDFKRHWEAYNE